jgi:SAM-dependent methyltransferase
VTTLDSIPTTTPTAAATPTAPPAPRPVDPDKLMAFVFRAVGEVGATLGTALVVLGDKLGYYRAMADGASITAAELAEKTGTGQPYAREWLANQAAGGIVDLDPATHRYTLPAEHAAALTDETSPAYLPGFFQTALGAMHDTSDVVTAARDGGGVGWHEHGDDVFHGTERFFRTMYNVHLVPEWIPALDGVAAKLEAGARVADVGCGHGASAILLAQRYPRSTFVGSDYHAGSIEIARQRAREAGVDDRVTFEVAPADAFTGRGFDLVTMFDCLHDMGDPVGAARHVRDAIAPDGTWMIVEPQAGDRIEDNLNPVGRTFYGFSTLLCTPASLSQDVGLALGTQAGPARIRDVATAAGFGGGFRTAASTPFNNVFEVRP